ncbi:MAG: thiamine phosphate synthase [Pseudomonadota bacterium]
MNPVDLSVYGIIDPAVTGRDDMPDRVKAALGDGLTLLQYRDKTGGTAEMIAAARRLKQVLSDSPVPLLINDRVDVAMAAGADGVHIGQTDMTPQDARNLLGPSATIGLTIKTAEDVDRAPLDLIDYACIGGVFVTSSKDNPSPPVGLDGLQAMAERLRARGARFPIGAIAGINAGNAGSVMAAGADGVAVISALFAADDIAAAARDLATAVASGRRNGVDTDEVGA